MVIIKYNSPFETEREPPVPLAVPEPLIVNVPADPLTPVALPLLATNLFVPTVKAEVVFTVTGALFNTNAPAVAPATVRGAVAPPP